MTDSDPPRFVDSYLLYLMAAASDKASAQFHARVRDHGLRVPEWRVLACLYDQEGMMVTELARLALMEQSRMTRIVDQMADRGQVRRSFDPADRRRVRIALTAEGRALASALVSEAKAHEAALLSKLEGTEAALLKPALMALLAQIDAGA